MKAILYSRVSSKEQLKGDSIEAQINRLKKFCKENNYEVVDIYTDAGKSASISDDKIDIKHNNGKFLLGINLNKRPQFERLIREVGSKKFDAIVFYKWDRFSRNSIFSKIAQIYFKRNGVKLIPTDDSTDPLMVEIKGVLGEEEIKKMKSRVREVRLLRFDKGIMVGKAPYGYRLNKDKKIMEIDKRKANIVRDVFNMASKGISYKEICKKHKLKPQSYYNIIKNKVYIGIIKFEGVEKTGSHPSIISQDLFDEIKK